MLGISFDSPEENRAFADKYGYSFRLLSDADKAVALAYGAAESRLDAYPRRLTFVIGPDGVLEQAIDTRDPGGQAASLLEGLGSA